MNFINNIYFKLANIWRKSYFFTQIADIVKLLDSLPAAERRRVVAVFNAPPLAISLDRPRIEPATASAETDFPHSMFSAVLRYALGEEALSLEYYVKAGERAATARQDGEEHRQYVGERQSVTLKRGRWQGTC